MNIDLQAAQALVASALRSAGAHAQMADSTARALVLAEAQGQAGHGLSRVHQYATHLRNGRVNGAAQASVIKRKGSVLLVDAQEGLAFPACDLAVREAVALARVQGMALVGIVNSHHCGVVVDHLRAAADAGMVGLGLSNSPAAMPAAGGRRAIFGTNPVAAVFPRSNDAPLLIDLSLSEVARGKVMLAAKKGEPIPLGWALDIDGQPTTDAKAALAGSMLPVGAVSSSKGAMLALIVELLVTAVIGGNFGFEADSFFCRRRQCTTFRAGVCADRSRRTGRSASLFVAGGGLGGPHAARPACTPARAASHPIVARRTAAWLGRARGLVGGDPRMDRMSPAG